MSSPNTSLHHDPDTVGSAIHDYRKDGLRFRLYPDGNITVSSKDLPERSLHQFDCIFGITNKRFSSLCRDMIREGFLDDMIAEQARISRDRGMKRNAGVELYDALEAMLEDGVFAGGDWIPSDNAKQRADAALAKARGES